MQVTKAKFGKCNSVWLHSFYGKFRNVYNLDGTVYIALLSEYTKQILMR